MLVLAAEPRNRLATFERCCLEGYFAPSDAHEIAYDDDAAIAQLRCKILPVARYVY